MAATHKHPFQNLAGVLLVLTTTACSTQPPIRSFSELDQRLRPGSVIDITNHDDLKTRAKITTITEHELILDLEGSPHTMSKEEIRKIDRQSNSMRKGFLIGLGTGVLNALFSDSQLEPCQNDSQQQCDSDETIDRLLTTGIFAAIGASVGYLIPRSDLVYLAPEKEAQLLHPRIAIMPYMFGNKPTPGVSVKLRF